MVRAGFPGRMGPNGSRRRGAGGGGPLRVASTLNRPHFSTQNPSAAHTNHLTRWRFTVGSGDFSQLFLNFNNFIFQATVGAVAPGNDVTVVKVAIEKGDGSVSFPVTFGGLRSIALADGDYDINTDAIDPALFGLTKFSRGEQYWIRAEYQVASSANLFGRTADNRTAISGQASSFYNSASTTLVNGVDGVGNYTVSGTSLVNANTGMRPFVLGNFVAGDPKTFVVGGDSIAYGQGDTNGLRANGVGFVQYAMTDPDFVSNPFACLNLAVAGSLASDWQATGNQRLLAYLKYGKHLIEQNLTNDIATGGSSVLATLKTRVNYIWSAFRAASPGGKVIRTTLLPGTTGAWTLADGSDQTISNGWDSGQNADLMNQYFMDSIGTLVDYVADTRTAVQNANTPFKWFANGTPAYETIDGRHPTTQGYVDLAVPLRVQVASAP